MAAPRKVFRIEQTAAARAAPRFDRSAVSPHHGEIAQALGALQALMAAPPAGLVAGALDSNSLTRIVHELDAVIDGTAQATQRILAAAEEIDQFADNLCAALKGRMEQELAQDISDSVLRIFEACNFQDLVGQRVAKVTKTLRMEEPSVSATADAPALHGPQLDGDAGHMSQAEIDALFGA
jgi:chemotaxis protein CheZ